MHSWLPGFAKGRDISATIAPIRFFSSAPNLATVQVPVQWVPGLRQPDLDATTAYHIYFIDVRFEVFTAVTMKNGVFWDVTPCGSCKN
jgi:hypothetical protein